MLPFLSLHALAAQRGDGLRPELLALFERHTRSETSLAAIIEAVETEPPNPIVEIVSEDSGKKCEVRYLLPGMSRALIARDWHNLE
jgi:hypothetical protein